MSTKKKVTKKKAVRKKPAVKKKTIAKKGPAKSKTKSTPKNSVKKPKTQAKSKSSAKAKSKTKVKAKTKTKATSKTKTETKSVVKAKSKTAKPKESSAKSAPSKKKGDQQDIPIETQPKPRKPVKLDGTTLKIRERLVENRTELLHLLESSQAQERNVGELNFSNEIDLASSLESREMGFQLSSRDRNELKLIDEALFKMKDGLYGICDSCEKKIGAKRLQILPLTSLCIECQESLEH